MNCSLRGKQESQRKIVQEKREAVEQSPGDINERVCGE